MRRAYSAMPVTVPGSFVGGAEAQHGHPGGTATPSDAPPKAARAVQWHQMARASEAVLMALDRYISARGGSRGARAIRDPAGEGLPGGGILLQDVRFRRERPEDRERLIVLRFRNGGFDLAERPNRTMDAGARPFFERDWPAGPAARSTTAPAVERRGLPQTDCAIERIWILPIPQTGTIRSGNLG